MYRKISVLTILLLVGFSFVAGADGHKGWNHLKDRLVTDGFKREYVDTVFAVSSVKYDSEIMARKMRALLKLRFEPPAKKKKREMTFDERYVGAVMLAGGYSYLREHYDYLVEIDRKYGVAPSVIVALLLVETKLGYTLGNNPAFSNLANMAASSDPNLFFDKLGYEKLEQKDMDWLEKRTQKKADWAYRELHALLKFSSDNSVDPTEIPGSPYGAFGICQFMPTTAISYGVDGDGDGRIDLFGREDALASMANFLKKHGWKNSLSKEKKLKVIYRYNHSKVYARTIYEVADNLERIRSVFGPSS